MLCEFLISGSGRNRYREFGAMYGRRRRRRRRDDLCVLPIRPVAKRIDRLNDKFGKSGCHRRRDVFRPLDSINNNNNTRVIISIKTLFARKHHMNLGHCLLNMKELKLWSI